MKFYVKKTADFITTLILISLVTFFTFQLLPGSPAIAILGPEAEDAQIQALEKELHLDQSLMERYFSWITDACTGELGQSYKYKQSVMSLISEGFETTFTLAILAFVFTIVLGIGMGLFFVQIRKRRLLKGFYYFSQIFVSIPSFCTALLLILIFSIKLRLLPSIGNEGILSFILPALSISLGSGAILARYIKISVENELKQDYVRTAKSKGLSENKIIRRHVLRNALLPSITTLGLIAADILGGSIIIENVFSLPGIGKLIVTSISTRDFPLIQGLTIYLAVITLLCNFVVDVLYSVVDPRIRIKA